MLQLQNEERENYTERSMHVSYNHKHNEQKAQRHPTDKKSKKITKKIETIQLDKSTKNNNHNKTQKEEIQ